MRYFILVIFFLSSCGTSLKNSEKNSDADWNAYLKFKKQFYVYNSLPIKTFRCKFEVPSFSDTLNKIHAGISSGEKYKSNLVTTGTLGFSGEFDSFIVFMPGIRVEKASKLNVFLWGPEDQTTKDVNEKTQMEAMQIRSYISALMHKLIISQRDEIKVKEVVLSAGESRALVSAAGIEIASRLRGTTMSYAQTMPNGVKINATTQFQRVKNGLIPTSSMSAMANALGMGTVNEKYEFQIVEGWRLPKRILVETNAQSGSTEVKSVIDIIFSDCKIEK